MKITGRVAALLCEELGQLKAADIGQADICDDADALVE
jgi:hypothetical protein